MPLRPSTGSGHALAYTPQPPSVLTLSHTPLSIVRRATLCTIATAASACIAHAASWYAIQGAAHPPAPPILPRLHTRLSYLIPALMHDQYQPCTLPSLRARILLRYCNKVCFSSQQGHACELRVTGNRGAGCHMGGQMSWLNGRASRSVSQGLVNINEAPRHALGAAQLAARTHTYSMAQALRALSAALQAKSRSSSSSSSCSSWSRLAGRSISAMAAFSC